MTETNNIVEFRSSRRRIEMPLPLYTFRKQIQQYLHTITEVKEALQDICDLFRQSDNIWPDQCEYAIDLMQTINDPIRDFCQLLNNPARLPGDVVPLRYPLLITSHNMSELVDSLIHHITQFCVVCQTPSKRTTVEKQMIESNLEELIQRSEDAQDRAQALFDQVDQIHFLKHELANR